MRILLLLTRVFRLAGGVHTLHRLHSALIKPTDEIAGELSLDITVLSPLDGEVRFQAAADYMSPGSTRYRDFKGNKAAFAAAGRDGTTRYRHYLSGGDSPNFCSEGTLAL